MPRFHSVQPGEHLSGIALQYGFANQNSIWFHPENAGLRKDRANPNVLMPGDTIYIPDLENAEVPCATDRRHPFQLNGDKLLLRIRIQEAFFDPVSSMPCQLSIEGRSYELTTDSEGTLEISIPKSASRGALTINGLEIPVLIGHLDPSSEVTGIRARLANLGYYRGSVDEVDEAELSAAISEFQCDQKLKITGECDSATRAKLEEIHGC